MSKFIPTSIQFNKLPASLQKNYKPEDVLSVRAITENGKGVFEVETINDSEPHVFRSNAGGVQIALLPKQIQQEYADLSDIIASTAYTNGMGEGCFEVEKKGSKKEPTFDRWAWRRNPAIGETDTRKHRWLLIESNADLSIFDEGYIEPGSVQMPDEWTRDSDAA